ncbi:MAG: hypothetical protein EA342_09915 [Leptolyngbya sp. LCM1.Bin17]|nr:MAG: hypothetical protein EA342_09915 [Leptolyngbya sp. LCM1.Bin17]
MGALIGGGIGLSAFLALTVLAQRFPGLDPISAWTARPAAAMTEVGIHMICGSASTMGCANLVGLLLFFLLWPIVYVIAWALMGMVGALLCTIAVAMVRRRG